MLERTENSYFSHAVTREDIAKIIDGLKNKMTCGPDGLPVAIIKRVVNEIA